MARRGGNPRRANGWRRDRMRRRLLAEYSTCWICGRPVDKSLKYPNPLAPVIDEKIPLACGGTLDYENLGLAHAYCNSVKGAHSVEYARRKLFGKPVSSSEPIVSDTSVQSSALKLGFRRSSW